MKKLIFALLLLISVASCQDELEKCYVYEGLCSTPATVVDMTGLDGCGFVIRLENGDLLEPIRMLYCGTPPLSPEITEDPLYNFEFVDGMKVTIDYTIPEEGYGSICMVGTQVFITCIEEVNGSSIH